MSNIRAPQFLVDLFRDLRDRRLLPVAAVLLVGLVAVPVALSTSSGSSTASPAAAVAIAPSEKDALAQAAVLSEDFGIRDYRKRLERFKSTNPFKQQFKLPEVTSSTLSEPPATSTDTSSSTTSSGGATTATGATIGSTSSTSPSSSSTPSSPAPLPAPEQEVLTHRIDVKVGLPGDLEKRENVKQLTLLPSKVTPVIAFLGASEDGKRALFLVSADVTAVAGDGDCLPSPSNCSYLTLKEGDQATLDYPPDAATYALELVEIKEVLLKRD
jgi:hypothetical protein